MTWWRTGLLARRASAVTVVLVVLVVPACSSGDPAVPATDEPDVGARVDPTRVGPAPDVEGALGGGTITVYLPGEPGPASFDPAAAVPGSAASSVQQALVDRSLTQLVRDPDGSTVLVPDLAVDLGVPDDDFTQWTFTLRDDATWQDGTAITAEQVAAGISRSLDVGAVPTGPEDRWSRPELAPEGVEVDGQQVVLHLSRPFPDLAWWASSPAVGPVPTTPLLASGPYELASASSQEVVLVRNDQWDPDTDPGRHQYVERWVLRFGLDLAKAERLVAADDAAAQTSVLVGLDPADYPAAKTELGPRLVVQPTSCVTYLEPDATRVPDLDVRRAIAAAYPSTEVWMAQGEVPGVTRVAPDSDLPPGVPGRLSHLVGERAPGHDPEAARQLLADAGHQPGELQLVLATPADDPRSAAVREAVQVGMAEAGFDVTLVDGDPGDPADARLDVRVVDLCADWPSGAAVLPALLGTGGRANVSGSSLPDVDDQLEEVARLPLEEQPDAWGALDEQVSADDLPVVPTGYTQRLLRFGAKIGYPTGEQQSGGPNYRELFVTD